MFLENPVPSPWKTDSNHQSSLWFNSRSVHRCSIPIGWLIVEFSTGYASTDEKKRTISINVYHGYQSCLIHDLWNISKTHYHMWHYLDDSVYCIIIVISCSFFLWSPCSLLNHRILRHGLWLDGSHLLRPLVSPYLSRDHAQVSQWTRRVTHLRGLLRCVLKGRLWHDLWPASPYIFAGWWFGTWLDDFPFSIWDHPKPIDELIFFKMVKTTNQ